MLWYNNQQPKKLNLIKTFANLRPIHYNNDMTPVSKKHIIYLIISATLLITSCSQVYHIQRHNGSTYAFDSYRWGDQHFLYRVEFYEDGSVKSETAEFDRKISPVLEQGIKFGESLIAGARAAL